MHSKYFFYLKIHDYAPIKVKHLACPRRSWSHNAARTPSRVPDFTGSKKHPPRVPSRTESRPVFRLRRQLPLGLVGKGLNNQPAKAGGLYCNQRPPSGQSLPKQPAAEAALSNVTENHSVTLKTFSGTSIAWFSTHSLIIFPLSPDHAHTVAQK
jgi:hypothetical protein